VGESITERRREAREKKEQTREGATTKSKIRWGPELMRWA
jgi:hypothetical protein